MSGSINRHQSSYYQGGMSSMVTAMEDGPPYQGHFWLPQLRPTLVESL